MDGGRFSFFNFPEVVMMRMRFRFSRVFSRAVVLFLLLMVLVTTPVLAASPAQEAADPVLPDFASTALIGAVPLMFVVMGLVQWSKKIKNQDGEQAIDDNALLFLSMAIGCVFGLIYMMMQSRPPVSPDWYLHFLYWAGAAVYGIAIGLLASGVFDAFHIKQS
jgi:amino acid transporter